MKKIISIGEYLIDMLPEVSGVTLKEVPTFIKKPGGAPINVAVGIKRLGGNISVVTQVGQDAFGEFLLNILNQEHMDTTYVYQTNQANTSLAFVSLDEKGERDFVFYRDPAADQLLDLSIETIESMSYDILHFGSVGLADYPLKTTTDRFISHATSHHKLISFDVNVRLMLFKDPNAYKNLILAYVKRAHIIKVSKEELTWLTGTDDMKEGVKRLWHPMHHIMIVSDGENGVYAFTRDQTYYQKAFKVEVIDTTGAGDALMGSFLFGLSQVEEPFKNLESWLPKTLERASYAGALACTKKGAMTSLPFGHEIIKN